MKVYKFTLETGASILGVPKHIEQTVRMPRGADILTAQMQGGELVIWAKVYPDHTLEDRVIETFGTGAEMPALKPGQQRIYIGTFQMDWFVGHIFELK